MISGSPPEFAVAPLTLKKELDQREHASEPLPCDGSHEVIAFLKAALLPSSVWITTSAMTRGPGYDVILWIEEVVPPRFSPAGDHPLCEFLSSREDGTWHRVIARLAAGQDRDGCLT